MKSQNILQVSAWLLTAAVVIIGIAAWAGNLRPPVSLGEFFPLLGILAFSLMWTHYVNGSLRRALGQNEAALTVYTEATSIIVLALLLLHPGLFYLQLYLDGLGLPPQSYIDAYPETASRIALVIGTISLLIFLVFELRRKYSDHEWWKYVNYAQIVAMFGIFYHALTLGGELISGWFRVVWIMYGIILLGSIIYNYVFDYRNRGRSQ